VEAAAAYYREYRDEIDAEIEANGSAMNGVAPPRLVIKP
jgi:hypothetical protein